jgi:hypothetical protein
MTETQIVGYKLFDEKTQEDIEQWGGVWGVCPGAPNPLKLPNGDQVHGAQSGWSNGRYRLDAWEMEKPAPTSQDVNNERDKRVSGDFLFNGKLFQFRVSDRENINGAGTLAALAIIGGAKPGDYLWHGGKEDFVWITSDNSLMKLDAFDAVNLGKAAAAWKSAHIFAARALKDQEKIPEDYATNDKYWPEKEVVV